MANQLDLRLNGIKGKSIAGGLTTSRKKFAVDARFVGRLISEAIRQSGLTPQEASFAMGYADQSALSRWMNGADVPQMLMRLLSIPKIRKGLVMAIVNVQGDGMKGRYVVDITDEEQAVGQ